MAGALGLTSARLSARLRDGNIVADIAADNGVKLQAAVDAALARHMDIVRWRIEDGYLTQTQAVEVLGLMEEQLRVAFEQGSGQGFGFGSGYYGLAPDYPTYGGFGGYSVGPGMMGGFGPMGGMMGGFWGRGGWQLFRQ